MTGCCYNLALFLFILRMSRVLQQIIGIARTHTISMIIIIYLHQCMHCAIPIVRQSDASQSEAIVNWLSMSNEHRFAYNFLMRSCKQFNWWQYSVLHISFFSRITHIFVDGKNKFKNIYTIKNAHIISCSWVWACKCRNTNTQREKHKKTVSHFWFCSANIVAVAGLTVVSCRFFPLPICLLLLLRKPKKNESKREPTTNHNNVGDLCDTVICF